tara:strand:- start:389 stop:571 length:183 start_codon:yes stop_codon:yes gene_type:complete
MEDFVCKTKHDVSTIARTGVKINSPGIGFVESKRVHVPRVVPHAFDALDAVDGVALGGFA